ncbi:MAG TPA: hypothetical protein ENJ32_07360 [Crenotrichaceae bacterium]|nr:hypothetical protein [Crenotrichaceae bacterium]
MGIGSVINVKPELVLGLCLYILLGVAAFTFWPALTGTFMLDDTVHVPKLGLYGSVDSAYKLYQLVFTFGGIGRPLSFLSLLINDNSWPTDPWGFKYTNLCIHLLNGLLVYLFSTKLLTLFLASNGQQDNRLNIQYTSLIACAAWLLHPIHISTMMMVIQRMTLLSATFTLLGLIFYLRYRTTLKVQPKKSLVWMSISVAAFGFLGILCKENAVTLVFYIAVIEYILFFHQKHLKSDLVNYWLIIFSLIPFIILTAYFVYKLSNFQITYEYMRTYNVWERLATESRVLLDYIRLIFLPNIRDAGPYHDDYVISRGLFEPWTTAPALLAISLLLITSFWLRNKVPLVSFAVLWFFTGHLLESTFIPLEIYFEHRNYLPMLGFYISLSYYITNYKGKFKTLILFLTFLYLSMETAIAYSSAKVWGDKALYSIIWAEEHPNSVRAQLDALRFSTELKNIDMVKRYINTLIQKNPNDSAAITLPYLFYKCSNNQNIDEPLTLNEILEKIANSDFSYGMVDSIRYLRKTLDNNECNVTFDEVLMIIKATLANPAFNRIDQIKSILYTELASVYKKQGNLNDTILSMDQAYEAMPKYEYCLSQANWLFSAGLHEDAKSYLRKARNTPYMSIYERLWKSDHISAAEQSFNIQMIQQ